MDIAIKTPTQIIAGDTVKSQLSLADYPAPDWTVTYSLVKKGATCYWIAESADIDAENEQAFDQVGMPPKTIGAYTEISRKLLKQTSMDIENFVRMDRAVEELPSGGRPGMPLPDDDRLDELKFQEKLLKRAVEVQQGVLRNLQSDLSEIIAKEHRPQYRQLVTDVIKAAACLREAVDADESFRDDLQRGGVYVDAHLQPMIFFNTKHRVEYFLNEAKKQVIKFNE